MREAEFQKSLISELKKTFPSGIILKTDPTYIQGFPDLLLLVEDRWAALECKRSRGASRRPNQEYYIELLDTMSYSRFVYPENKEEILDELYDTFRA